MDLTRRGDVSLKEGSESLDHLSISKIYKRNCENHFLEKEVMGLWKFVNMICNCDSKK